MTKLKNKTKPKNKVLKVLTLAVLCFATAMLTGCANITYSRSVSVDGQISESISVQLKEQELAAAGVNIANLKEDVATHISLNLFKGVNQFKTFLTTGTNATETNKVIANNITTNLTKQGSVITGTVTFKNDFTLQTYNAWQNSKNPTQPGVEDEENNNLPSTNNGFLYNHITQVNPNAFSKDMLVDNPLSNYYQETYATPHNLSFGSLTFKQIYASNNLKLKSNATQITFEEGLKVHTWDIETPLLPQTPMEFYFKTPITQNWYLIAIVLGVATAVSILVYVKYKNKTTSTKTTNTK